MKYNFLPIILLIILQMACQYNRDPHDPARGIIKPEIVWKIEEGGTGNLAVSAYGIASNADGIFLVGSGKTDEGQTGIFLARYDRDGEIVWKQIYRENIASIFFGSDIAATEDELIVVGYTQIGVWFGRFDLSGNCVYSRLIEEPQAIDIKIFDLEVDRSGRIVFAGYFNDGTMKPWVGQLVSNGYFTWATVENTEGYYNSVSICTNGEISATGVAVRDSVNNNYLSMKSASGNEIWKNDNIPGVGVKVRCEFDGNAHILHYLSYQSETNGYAISIFDEGGNLIGNEIEAPGKWEEMKAGGFANMANGSTLLFGSRINADFVGTNIWLSTYSINSVLTNETKLLETAGMVSNPYAILESNQFLYITGYFGNYGTESYSYLMKIKVTESL